MCNGKGVLARRLFLHNDWIRSWLVLVEASDLLVTNGALVVNFTSDEVHLLAMKLASAATTSNPQELHLRPSDHTTIGSVANMMEAFSPVPRLLLSAYLI